MEIIRSYVESAFAAYASTPQMRNLKEEILSNMEEKYRELKAQGHSENEAIGTVISEFGNIDELVRELGIYSYQTGFSESSALPPLSEENANKYLAEKKRSGLLIALGVSLCILSPIFAILTEGFHTINVDMAVSFSISFLFFLVAVAVFLFIFAGMRLQRTEEIVKHPLYDNALRDKIKVRQSAFQTRFAIGIGVGVVLCILSVVPVIMLEEFCANSFFSENFAPALMLAIIAVGVFLFVYLGIEADSYKKLLEKEAHKNDAHTKKTRSERAIEIAASIYWCLITAVYFLWSFGTYDWGRSWIIWPVAGVLFGAITGIIKACIKDDPS